MEKSTAKRSKNFSEFEKTLLFDILQTYQHIIENKKTDSVNMKIKSDTWEVISKKFNSSCQGGDRTAKQLHALYDCMKKKARKNMNDDRVRQKQ